MLKLLKNCSVRIEELNMQSLRENWVLDQLRCKSLLTITYLSVGFHASQSRTNGRERRRGAAYPLMGLKSGYATRSRHLHLWKLSFDLSNSRPLAAAGDALCRPPSEEEVSAFGVCFGMIYETSLHR
ncbi:hypothetical protein EVAR_39254_1 [Eumeta japonica]|uniref:Uncharacterized protein n=1 Tax=Eumeta variegata TaxID=151549 RepID=A0A4C1Y0Z7_EUMVA|nr:hypothetical protein EVAR_39254_1 [Eumeta japonica]